MSKVFTRLVGAMAVLALVAVPTATANGASVGAGLWSSAFQTTLTDCGSFGRDTSNFCYVDDNGSVELGVKFTSSKAVNVAGVRIYRTDAGEVTGSLWTAGGTRLAGATSFSGNATHGWQDVMFSAPITITPGDTYVASYFAPNAQYAFQYNFYTSSYTVGPITALASVTGNPNGVYCYVGEACSGFPTNSFLDTNYWVTPLWAYKFAGFYQPVDNGVWNGAKAGSGIRVKFSLGGDQGLGVLKNGYPTATQITCPGGSTSVDAIEEIVTAGGSSLSYDASTDQYVYVWKTNKAWAGKCYRFELGLNDDTSHTFDVQFK